MKLWMTSMLEGRKDTRAQILDADASGFNREMRQIAVYTQATYQTIHGFGGAFTDAAGSVYARMDAASREEFLRTCFDPCQMGYTWGRTSIDSCDFSEEMYAADDVPADVELRHMDYARGEKYVLPMLKDAEGAAGRPIHLMLTPWSPPVWMKTNDSRVQGGRLRQRYAPVWAEYICRYVERCLEIGLDVRLLSSQNEPHAAQSWDSCIMDDADEKVFLRDYLIPALRQHGLGERVTLLIWDHNKEYAYERTEAILSDPELIGPVGGVGFHWYSGDHFENLNMIRERWPDKRLVFTEGCVEHSIWGTDAELIGAVKYAHEYIGDINAGADTLIDWNLLLDAEGGPNHVGNFCDAPMMYDFEACRLHKRLSLDYIGHFSRFIKPGAVRLGVSRFSADIELTAARNPDGSVAVVVLNRSDREETMYLKLNGRFYPMTLPAWAIATCVEG